MTQGKHEVAATKFLSGIDWLSDDHPMAVSLLSAAEALDKEFQTALYTAYNVSLRWIENNQPSNDEDGDDEDDLLSPTR